MHERCMHMDDITWMTWCEPHMRRQCSRRIFSEGADPVLSPLYPSLGPPDTCALQNGSASVFFSRGDLGWCVHMHCHLHTWRKRASSVTLTNMHQSHRVEEHLPLLPRACTCCIDVQLVWCMKMSCVFLQRRLYLRDPESWQEGSTSRSAYPTKYFVCYISPNHVIEYLATIG